MKSNKSKSRFGSAAIIYLIILLLVVILYLGVVYPKLALQINTLNADINSLTLKNNMLSPYAGQLSLLNEKAEKAEKEFENNTELDNPILFSNIIYNCADSAGVNVTNLNIAESGIVEIEGDYESFKYTAAITITALDNTQLEKFVSLLEQNAGSALSMQSINYIVDEGALSAEMTLLMYAVAK